MLFAEYTTLVALLTCGMCAMVVLQSVVTLVMVMFECFVIQWYFSQIAEQLSEFTKSHESLRNKANQFNYLVCYYALLVLW